MDKRMFERAEAATKGKSGLIDGPQEEIALNTATPGQQPWRRPMAKNPTTESNT